jgi:hypothetical protein
LAILWDSKGLQGRQTQLDGLQISSDHLPRFGHILDTDTPYSLASPHAAGVRGTFNGSRTFVSQTKRGAFMAAEQSG